MGKDTKDDKIILSKNLSIKSLEKAYNYESSKGDTPLRMMSKMNVGAASGKLIRNDSIKEKSQKIERKGSQTRK